MKPIRCLLASLLALPGLVLASADQVPAVGVDTAGTYFIRDKRYAREGWHHSAFREAVGKVGASFLVDHYFELTTGQGLAENRRQTLQRLRELGAYLREHEVEYLFNVETANWTPRAEWIPGTNLFEPLPGLHHYVLPDEILGALAVTPGVLGLVYDEIEHMQINNSYHTGKGDRPALADTRGLSLPDAQQAIVARLHELRRQHEPYGLKLVAETVWPALHHLFAQAGWIISPKLLKESFTPVPIALALGAGIQYQYTGTEVWINPDLWFCGHYPGHSTDAMRSALAYSHWLGVPRVYQENLDYVNVKNPVHQASAAKGFDYTTAERGKHHPDALAWRGSLVQYRDGDTFDLTPYGEALRDYAAVYRPAHPVPYTWKEARCRVAIVRFEDSVWGQSHSAFPDTPLGSKVVKSSPASEAWFGLWHRLSHGVIPATTVSYHSRHIKYKRGPQFFVPAPPTLVFDHQIGDTHPDFDFRGAQIIFGTGIELTPATLALLERQVEAGLTVVSLPHLAPPALRERFAAAGEQELEIAVGRGRWLIARDFLGPQVLAALQPHLGPSDELQHQFGEHFVQVRRVDDDRVEIYVDGTKRYSPPATPSQRVRWDGAHLVPLR